MMRQRPWLAAILALVGLVAAYRRHVKPWMYAWGATADEVAATYPGDELVEPGLARTTRAVAISAPVGAVWQWLVQIGEDRGGFYSYSLLERAAGADIHNASKIHPEWQDLEVGDVVSLARRYGDYGRQVVAAVEPNSHLVLVSKPDYERIRRGEKATGSWAFYLISEGASTRLVVRGSGGAVGRAAFDIPHFVMESKMLRGIRSRAEELV